MILYSEARSLALLSRLGHQRLGLPGSLFVVMVTTNLLRILIGSCTLLSIFFAGLLPRLQYLLHGVFPQIGERRRVVPSRTHAEIVLQLRFHLVRVEYLFRFSGLRASAEKPSFWLGVQLFAILGLFLAGIDSPSEFYSKCLFH